MRSSRFHVAGRRSAALLATLLGTLAAVWFAVAAYEVAGSLTKLGLIAGMFIGAYWLGNVMGRNAKRPRPPAAIWAALTLLIGVVRRRSDRS